MGHRLSNATASTHGNRYGPVMLEHEGSLEPSTKSLGVFCGSRAGNDSSVLLLANELGEALADAGVNLVYGGAGIGVMGAVADAVLAAGGHVIGVIPSRLFSHEVPHQNLSEHIEVTDMHARKRIMYNRSDAFCALPGGYGTLDELFAAATWTQLDLHSKPKPVALLDGGAPGSPGFWSHLEMFLDTTVAQGLINQTPVEWLYLRN